MDIYRDDTRDKIVDLTANRLQEAIIEVPEKYWDMDEGELNNCAKYTQTDKGLRFSFWREIERVWARREKGNKSTITAEMVYLGVCSRGYFYNTFLKKPNKVAWMVCPMQRYEKRLEVILSGLHERVYEITELPVYKTDRNGNKVPDASTAKVILEAVKMVEDRLLGSAVQRTVTKNQNEIVKKKDDLLLPADVDKRIKELEALIKKPQQLVIEGDVEPTA